MKALRRMFGVLAKSSAALLSPPNMNDPATVAELVMREEKVVIGFVSPSKPMRVLAASVMFAPVPGIELAAPKKSAPALMATVVLDAIPELFPEMTIVPLPSLAIPLPATLVRAPLKMPSAGALVVSMCTASIVRVAAPLKSMGLAKFTVP